MRRRDDLADEHADGCARRPEAGRDEHEDRHHAEAGLDQEVRRQRAVGPVGLQQPAVEGEEDEEGGGGQDGRDADAALLVEQFGHAVPGREDDDRPQEDRPRCTAGAPAPPSAARGGRCRPRARR